MCGNESAAFEFSFVVQVVVDLESVVGMITCHWSREEQVEMEEMSL